MILIISTVHQNYLKYYSHLHGGYKENETNHLLNILRAALNILYFIHIKKYVKYLHISGLQGF